MEPQTLDSLQGIKTEKELKAANEKISFYRESLGLKMGAKPKEGFSLMADLSPQQLRSVEDLCRFLEGEADGAETLDSIFRDSNSFDELARQLAAIGGLMAMLDNIEPERDFPERAAARSMLGSLSLALKRTSRIAAGRGTKIRHFT